MIYVICNVETGELLQVSEQPLVVSGHPLMVKAFDMPMPDMTKVQWHQGRFEAANQNRIITKLAYLRRFTGDERVAIRTAAKVNPVLDDYMALLELAEEVNLDDLDTVMALAMLEQAGLLAVGRGVEILA